jgi:two-component system, OmpR family, sensor histidine kinase BaeS
MKRRLSLAIQVFLSILLVALGAVLTVGLIARDALSRAFDAYLAGLPTPAGGGRGMGRVMLGAAEQTFIQSVDQSVYLASMVAVVVATLVAYLLAKHLSDPLRKLEHAAEQVSSGDLAHRVETAGPAEVASLGEAFNSMADSLQSAEELRRRLVADVSHELRNPIAAARAQAEGMVDGIVAINGERLSSLLDDLRHLSLLVDELQELSTAESGRLPYDMSDVDLVPLALREVRRAASMANAEVSVELDDRVSSAVVLGDETRLSQVMRNLLSNALRHTATGTISVSVSVVDGIAAVSVRDTGEGIAEEDLPFVFERFYRTDPSRATKTGGSGLGLAISRQIVIDHAGSVFASGNDDGGATVGFRIPLVD